MRTIKSLSIALLLLAGLSAAAHAGNTPNGFRLGVQAGYPTAITFGHRTSADFEYNFMAGTNYSYGLLGANALFNVATPTIEKEPFPLSVGPQAVVGIWKFQPDNNPVSLDVLGLARMEYSFTKAPINLFLEFGVGASILPYPNIAFSGGLGVRVLFDSK